MADNSVAQPKVGSTVWVFDHNHRVYKDRTLIYREHWVPVEITGETRVSWITWYGKLPKKPDARGRFLIPQGGYSPLRVVLTAAEVDDDVWLSEHAHRISERVRHCDVQTLRKIADLIGYKATEVER